MTLTEQRAFEQQILEKISPQLGKVDEKLFEYYRVKANPISGKYPKNANGIVVNRILDVDIDEAIKQKINDYNISIRTVRVEENGSIKQSASLPIINFEDVVKEEWQNSSLRNYLMDTRFLFVVFKGTENQHYQLMGAKFWSMSSNELESTVKDAWNDTINTIKQGVELCYDVRRNRVTNNFISVSDRRIIHVRPKARKSSYMAYNSYADRLPVPAKWKNKPDNYSDDWMTRQCFWLNSKYLEELISEFIN